MSDEARIGLSRQMVLQKQMDIIANNIANVTTTAFKAQHLEFSEYLDKHTGAHHVQAQNSYRDISQGAIKPTYNELDFSIHGDGFFAVQLPDGTTKYTRNGSFSLDGNGGLVNKAGYPVLGDQGTPITIPSGITQITVDKAGNITSSQSQSAIGKLKLAMFDNQQAMTPLGNNLYDAHDAPEQTVDKPNIVQGMLEASNVNAIAEMTQLDKVTDMYTAAQGQVKNDHQRAESMIKVLTKRET